MADPISKTEFLRRLSVRMKSDEKTAGEWLEGVTETLYKAFKEGHGVTIQGFGVFIWNKDEMDVRLYSIPARN